MKEVIFYDMEEIQSFVDRQLNSWNLASQNYKDLYGVKRRSVSIGDFEATIQCNPARIISTAAKVNDGMTISRPCFLCKKNRPSSQFEKVIFPGWEMLVNPYPIFPVHLTIVNSEHIPQSRMPEAMVDIADCLPGMAVFFNGARAGASAPDHLHLQAVMKDELPIVKIAETYHSDSDLSIRPSSDFNLDLPFLFYSGVVRKEFKDSQIIRTALSLGGLSEDGTLTDPTLVNSFFWKDNTGALRFIIIPRKAHRPSCFFETDEAKRRLISPGCIDMAGVIITPREKDFLQLTEKEIKKIFEQVAIRQ